jgi:CelD/BcsL family acetyltransferase involved in cellulose biosynthesis
MVLPALNGEAAMTTALADAFQSAGLPTTRTVTEQAPYLPLPATWDAYLKGLAGRDRYKVTRSLRDFDKWADGSAQLHVAATPAELVEGRRILVRLHRERWDAEKQPGKFRAPRYIGFHEEVMAQFLQQGRLELAWLSVRGEPIAAQYNLVWNEKVYYYQCGRKMDLPMVRPGFVLHAYLIRRAIEAGRREYDFLGGVSPYKMQLAKATRPLVQLRAARVGWLETTRRAVESGITLTRSVRRSLTQGRGHGAPGQSGNPGAGAGD